MDKITNFKNRLFVNNEFHLPKRLKNWKIIDAFLTLIVSNAIIISLIIITALKYKHLKHPATYLAIGVNIFNCFMEPLGRWPALQEFFNAVIKG